MADRTAFLFGTKRYLSNITPAAPGGSVNVVWTSDGENISASLAKAAAQTPWTQDIDGAGYSLNGAGNGQFTGYVESAVAKGFAGNLYFDGTNFRYRANGTACLLHASSAAQWSALYTASTGAAMGIASITEAIKFRDDGVVEVPRTLLASGTNKGISCGFASAISFNAIYSGGWKYIDAGAALVISNTGGGSTGFYAAVTGAAGGAMSLTTVMKFRDDGVVEILRPFALSGLPSSNPGAGTKQLWYDPADGNRVKFAA